MWLFVTALTMTSAARVNLMCSHDMLTLACSTRIRQAAVDSRSPKAAVVLWAGWNLPLQPWVLHVSESFVRRH